MSLEQLGEKLAKMASARKTEVGGLNFNLLGLFVRENDFSPVDLVAAAPGLNYGDLDSFRRIVKNLTEFFEPNDFKEISRIVIFDQNSTILQCFLDEYADKPGLSDTQLQTEGGVLIKKAFVVIAEPVRITKVANQPSTSTRTLSGKGRSMRKKSSPPRKNPEHA